MTDRELDALVHKHVFGKAAEIFSHKKMFDGFENKPGSPFTHFGCHRCGERWLTLDAMEDICSVSDPPPRYSTTGDGMLAVWRKMHELKWQVCVENVDGGFHFDGPWDVQMRKEYGEWIDADDPNPERCMSVCALKALGVDVSAFEWKYPS